MTNLTEYQFKTAAEQSQQLSISVAKQLNEVILDKGQAVLAVSGGRSPIPFFEALSQIALPWEKVTITLVDERAVSTTHKDSNTALVREYLLINCAKLANFQSLLADDLSDAELSNVEELAANAVNYFRQPDVVILGMGEDAHTASLFPMVADLYSEQNVITVSPTDAPYQRLSMTLKTILKARRVFLSIGGDAKMAVYQQAKTHKAQKMPISYVLNQDQTDVEVFFYG